MRRRIGFGKGWAVWTHRLGFSWKSGAVRADMEPRRNPAADPPGLLQWRGELWLGEDRAVLATVWGDNPWECARAVELAAKDLNQKEAS